MPRESTLAGQAPRTGRGFGRWLFRSALFLLLCALLVTIVPVLLMRWWDPFTSAFMLRAQVEAIASGDTRYRTRYTWVDLEDISPHAAMAVIAAEDQLFRSHRGFDVESIRKAVETNSRRKRVRGASTISQQTAKNLFLWPERSYVRKGLEAWFTVLIETFWGKDRILEVYLNVAEFGRGVYGVEAASQRYFRKPASRLTRSEAALLAAVLPNPRRFRVDRPSAYVLSRRDWILGQMRSLGGSSYLRDITFETRAAR